MGPSGAVVRADRHPEIRADVPKTFLVGRPRNPVRARACDLRRGRHHCRSPAGSSSHPDRGSRRCLRRWSTWLSRNTVAITVVPSAPNSTSPTMTAGSEKTRNQVSPPLTVPHNPPNSIATRTRLRSLGLTAIDCTRPALKSFSLKSANAGGMAGGSWIRWTRSQPARKTRDSRTKTGYRGIGPPFSEKRISMPGPDSMSQMTCRFSACSPSEATPGHRIPPCRGAQAVTESEATKRSDSSTSTRTARAGTDVDERMRNREPIEIPFGDGLLTLTWEPGPDDTLS